jgi:hypothetical protein
VEQEVGGSSPPNCTRLPTRKISLRPPRHLCCGVSATRACESVRLHPQFAQIIALGGIGDVFSIGTYPVWIIAGDGVLGFAMAGREQRLHPRAGASLHRRCVSPLQFRHSRCQPRNGLHGPEQVAALAGLPGAIQIRSRAKRGYGQIRRPADRHPACHGAQAGERQTAEGQETVIQAGETRRDLTVLFAFQGPFARQTDALASRVCNGHLFQTRRGLIE